jgi:hypothetical protein
MENKKQTAVEWLIDKIQDQRENGNNDLRTTLYYCEQANKIFEEQIIDSYRIGYIKRDEDKLMEAKKYYNETYGTK